MKALGVGFRPSSYPDIPLYNIQAVTAATGVPAITLRSWERRYGIPQPKRDPKGYRLYSERDIAVTRWLKERVQEGVGISRAVHMLQVLEQEGPMAEEPRTLDLSTLRERLLDAIRAIDETAVSRVVAQALMVATVEEVCLDVLQATLYRVGELWSEGLLSVTTEHHGSNLLRSHLAQLVRLSPAPLRAERVVVGSAPGEMHDIGALMLALFLRRRGFDVIFAGANVEAHDFVEDVLNLRPAVVGLSAGRQETAHSLQQIFARLHGQTDSILCFGGRVFNEQPALREATIGSWIGTDAAEATRTIEALLESDGASGNPGPA